MRRNRTFAFGSVCSAEALAASGFAAILAARVRLYCMRRNRTFAFGSVCSAEALAASGFAAILAARVRYGVATSQVVPGSSANSNSPRTGTSSFSPKLGMPAIMTSTSSGSAP